MLQAQKQKNSDITADAKLKYTQNQLAIFIFSLITKKNMTLNFT